MSNELKELAQGVLLAMLATPGMIVGFVYEVSYAGFLQGKLIAATLIVRAANLKPRDDD